MSRSIILCEKLCNLQTERIPDLNLFIGFNIQCGLDSKLITKNCIALNAHIDIQINPKTKLALYVVAPSKCSKTLYLYETIDTISTWQSSFYRPTSSLSSVATFWYFLIVDCSFYLTVDVACCLKVGSFCNTGNSVI